MNMKLNKYINNRPVGGNYFFIQKRTGGNDMDFYLDQFNIDDYWIYKYSNKQKLVSIQEFLNFEYSGYIFFRKDLYNKDHINLWLNKINELMNNKSGFLVKPLPPFDPDKIIIKK